MVWLWLILDYIAYALRTNVGVIILYNALLFFFLRGAPQEIRLDVEGFEYENGPSLLGMMVSIVLAVAMTPVVMVVFFMFYNYLTR